jgi:hypothetical protein
MPPLNVDAPAVQSHLAMLQGIIARMAANSASCKAWCVGLVSAILVVAADKGRPTLLVTCMVPVLLFLVLDAYYLALERRFRTSYEAFVRRLHEGTASVEDAFVLSKKLSVRQGLLGFGEGLLSFSVWPFYVTLSVLLVIVGRRLL